MANQRELGDGLAKYALAEELADSFLSDRERGILERYRVSYQEGQQRLAELYGAMGNIPVEAEDDLSRRLWDETPGVYDLLDKTTKFIDQILDSGQG